MHDSLKLWLMMLGLMLAIGCDGGADLPPEQTELDTQSESQAVSPTEQKNSTPRVVFLGDSLTAGYGLEDVRDAFPAVIERQLASEGIEINAVNAGVSGDTTAGGLRRLDWVLQQKPDVLVVCLGGNDGLRNLDARVSQENLRQIINTAQESGAKVLLLGMMIPTNYGPEYREQFASIYPALAEEKGVPIVPFALEGVGGVPELNLPDGIHPTAEGHEVIASNVIGQLRELLPADSNEGS